MIGSLFSWQLASPLYQQVCDVADKTLRLRIYLGNELFCGLRAFTKEAYLRAARNTFLFPGMAGREMAMRKGHGEMEKGGGGGGGVKEVARGRQRGRGGAREGAKIGWLMFYNT